MIIDTGLVLLHKLRKTSRNLVSTTIYNFRYEGRRSIALVLLLTKLWGSGLLQRMQLLRYRTATTPTYYRLLARLGAG